MAVYAIGAVLAGSVEDPCCCGGPPGCCLYPWPGIEEVGGSTFYPATDTPETLVVTTTLGSGTFTRTADPDYSGFRWNGTLGGDDYYVIAVIGGPGFAITRDLGGGWDSIAPCLIGDYSGLDGPATVEDEFPDTLIIDFDYDPGTGVIHFTGNLERGLISGQELCCWSGSVASDPPTMYFDEGLFLCYRADGDNPYKFVIYADPDSAGPLFGVKDPTQDTPEGNYDGGAISGVTNIVVTS